MLVCPNLEDVLVQVHASVAEMRPPTAIFFGFGKVELDIACTQEFRIALLQNVSVRCSDKACAPEREMTFDTRAVCCNHECAVCNRMSAHDRHPAILLSRINFLGLRIHPANSGRIDEHVGALEAHDAGCFGEPLVPANKHAKRTGASLDWLKTGVTWNKVILFVEGGIIGNVTLAIKPCDASVAFKYECRIVVNATGTLFKEREKYGVWKSSGRTSKSMSLPLSLRASSLYHLLLESKSPVHLPCNVYTLILFM